MISPEGIKSDTGAASLATGGPASLTGRPAPVFTSMIGHSGTEPQRSEQAVDWSRVRAAITEPRLGPYLADANGDEKIALASYHHNLRVSGAVYEDLAIVEVALRNAMDTQLRLWNAIQTGANRNPDWLLSPAPLLRRLLRNDLTKATGRARGVGQMHPTHNDLLTHMTLGTWRYLLPDSDSGKQYLWRAALSRAFPHMVGQPQRMTDAVTGVWLLRNRVAHLEPLTKVSALRRQVRSMRFILRSIDPALEMWFDVTSRLPTVLAQIEPLP